LEQVDLLATVDDPPISVGRSGAIFRFPFSQWIRNQHQVPFSQWIRDPAFTSTTLRGVAKSRATWLATNGERVDPDILIVGDKGEAYLLSSSNPDKVVPVVGLPKVGLRAATANGVDYYVVGEHGLFLQAIVSGVVIPKPVFL